MFVNNGIELSTVSNLSLITVMGKMLHVRLLDNDIAEENYDIQFSEVLGSFI